MYMSYLKSLLILLFYDSTTSDCKVKLIIIHDIKVQSLTRSRFERMRVGELKINIEMSKNVYMFMSFDIV